MPKQDGLAPKDMRGVEIVVGDILYHPMQNGCASPLISIKRVLEIVHGKQVRVQHYDAEARKRDYRRFSTLRYPSRCVVDLHERTKTQVPE